jgi:hypothetical protein
MTGTDELVVEPLGCGSSQPQHQSVPPVATPHVAQYPARKSDHASAEETAVGT